ncbi:MAG: hypothetical protein E7481_04970 [Ruminococcaceae bacterium]|nr:hypothetical protein [Oscillospiraceae bacterium]
MSKGKKKNKAQGVIGVIFFMLIGFFCGILMAEYAFSSDEPILGFIILFVSMYVTMILQIIIHEGGHLIFGLLTGYKFVSFRIGSFTLIRINNELKFKKLSLAGTGGQCLLSPPEMKDGKIPYVLYNLGGSILNTITAIVFLILGLVFKEIEILNAVLIMAAIVGFAYALMNGIPLRLGTIDNDGYNTLSMSKDPKALRSLWIQMKASEMTANGVRLKDMPEEWFTLPEKEEMKNSMTAVLGVFACNRLMDELRFDEAEKLMKEYLNEENAAVGIYKSLMTCDIAFCEMIKDLPDTEAIEKLLDKQQKAFMKSMKNYPSVLRTEYTYQLLIKKDIPTALKLKKQFEKVLKTHPYTADVESETELIQIAETKAVMPLNEL